MANYDLEGLSIPLDALKKEMNVDYPNDDEYITMLGQVALQCLFRTTRRSVSELKQMNGGVFPQSIILASTKLAAHWYRVREVVSSTQQVVVPCTFELLIKPYIRLGRREGDDD